MDTTVPPTSVVPLDENGIGDALFPALGNPGIDVEHYDLTLEYDPTQNRITAPERRNLAGRDLIRDG